MCTRAFGRFKRVHKINIALHNVFRTTKPDGDMDYGVLV